MILFSPVLGLASSVLYLISYVQHISVEIVTNRR